MDVFLASLHVYRLELANLFPCPGPQSSKPTHKTVTIILRNVYVFSMDINAELQIFLIIFIFIQCAINLSQPSSYNRLYFDRLLCNVNILTFTGHLYILHESE